MTDESPSQHLTHRQERLLEILVREYTTHPEPVSSKMLSVLSDLGLSSATIRNEMAVLEEAGYIRAPHTSAGRVPTEEGYRYFVKRLLNDPYPQLPDINSGVIRARFQEVPAEMDAWMQNAAMILAQHTQTAALVTEPRLKSSNRFKQVQLIAVQGRLVLMVLVLDGGNVHQQMLIMAEPVAQEPLNQASELINRTCPDMAADQIRDRARTFPSMLAQDIGELVADALQQLNEVGNRVIYQAGLGNILPEFEDDGARQAVKVLEGKIDFDVLLAPDQRNIQVIVGGEGRWEELSNLSMVLARYGTTRIIGTVGVIGPTRMRYGNAISTVNFMASLISEFLSDVHGDDVAALDTGEE